jgi:DNA-binding response OmpR family regulator
MRLLLIEDEPAMQLALCDLLRAEGYRVTAAADGISGLAHAVEEVPDLILLDVMLPGMDGLALCRELRRRGLRMPVLMLTARGYLDDRVEGLDAGADDYLVKPFANRELLARIRALIRRETEREKVNMLTIAGTVIDFDRSSALRGSERIELSQRELLILRALAEARGEPLTRQQILDAAWEPGTWPAERTVDNLIASLRAALEPIPAVPRHILTVHRRGYRLAV